jgi:hypothetical protein
MKKKTYQCLAGVLIPLAALAAVTPEYTSARAKLTAIGEERLAPGSQLVFSGAEVNAYASHEARTHVPDGVRNPRISLSASRAVASAMVDFARIQDAQGEPPGLIMRYLLTGERPVRVQLRVQSANGMCRVDVERVEVSDVPVEGRGLTFLIENFVKPRFPEAKIGQWFELESNLDSVEIRPGAVVVRAKG